MRDMKSNEAERQRFPTCLWLALPRMHLPQNDVWKCTNRCCGLQFAFPQLDEENLRVTYTHLYYPSESHSKVVHYENTSASIFSRVFRKIEFLSPSCPLRLRRKNV